MDFCMKEGKSSHLSEFNSIFSQPVALKFVIDNEFKATLWLWTSLQSWDTFTIAMSNSNAMILYANVETSLLMEEMNQQNNAPNKSSIALYSRGRSQQRGKLNIKGQEDKLELELELDKWKQRRD